MIIAETERLILRRFEIDDGPAMDRVFGDPDVMRFGNGAQTREWVRNWLRTRREIDDRKPGYGQWGVVRKDDRILIGVCGLTYFSDVCGSPETEIGYRLARDVWGNGYATEAAVAVRDYGFSSLSLERMIALIDPQNVASIRVAEKLGMRYEQDVTLDGYTHPDRLYAMSRQSDLD